MNLNQEIQKLQYADYPEIFRRFRSLASESGLPMNDVLGAFARVGKKYGLMDPYIQNRRVKAIPTLPNSHDKNAVGDMLVAPQDNETGLREVSHALEFTAYPYFKIRKTYQDLLTYHYYNFPAYLADDFKEKDWDALAREWRLVDKVCEAIRPRELAHKVCGQALQEGKVFYATRWAVDKSHNQVKYAFSQQLPSNWCKITGYNNRSKYTVAFNMMYFCQPGTDPSQFGDLFAPYWNNFQRIVQPASTSLRDSGLVFASQNTHTVDLGLFRQLRENASGDLGVDVFQQSGTWFYWVYLPPERVTVFEIDDTNALAVSPLVGLFLSMLQLAKYEDLQMELVSNPLIAVLTGEIPYFNTSSANDSDGYKLSNAGREMFEFLWYQMLMNNNTSGIGIYFAPAENMKLQQLAEAPSATQIAGNGYAYTMQKAGLTSIIPTNTDPRVGQANISMQLESRYAQQIYACMERMMENIYRTLGLKYDWRFKMFGSLAEDEKAMEKAEKGMQNGILSDTLTYLALKDRTLLEDYSVSSAIFNSGLLDLRIPLITSYSAKAAEGSLPPQVKHDMNPGGRPKADKGNPQTEGQEQDEDSYGG